MGVPSLVGMHAGQQHRHDDRQSGAPAARCTTPSPKKMKSLQRLSESPESKQLDSWTLSPYENQKLRSQLAGGALENPTKSSKHFLRPLLPPKEPEHAGCATLVLDLDETLIHSSMHTPPPGTQSFQLLDEVKGSIMHVAVRPGVPAFLAIMAEHCEIVLFTAATQVCCEPSLPLPFTRK